MEKHKKYNRTKFSEKVLREAAKIFKEKIDTKAKTQFLLVEIDDITWENISEEEFFADYSNSTEADYRLYGEESNLFISYSYENTKVQVKAAEREKIEAIFNLFERNLEKSLLPKPPPKKPVVFIGHGQSKLWRDLKDHLQDKHGIQVEAYEIGARAGHTVRDILEDMLVKSSFAVLVMTGEDVTIEGKFRPRENVIHEAGLFQGQLGFRRAIILLEEDIEEFSNIKGIEQIRFSKGNIKETYGDVLATLKREFPESMV